MKPLVSVILITYNRKELITETLNSILNQTFKDFELLIIDNYSDYDFFGFIDSYEDTRIRAFQHANDGVLAVNRNFGMKEAKGEYIAFCDDDDLWLPEKLEKQVALFKEFSDVLLVATNCTYFPKTKTRYHWKKHKVLSYSEQLIGNWIPQPSVMISREVFEKVGGQDESKEIAFVEDYDYWLQILAYRDHSAIVHKEPLTMVRMHANNYSRNWGEQLQKLIKVLEKHQTRTEQDLVKKLLKQKKAMLNRTIVKYAFYQNQSFSYLLFSKIAFWEKIDVWLRVTGLKIFEKLNLL